MNIKKKQPKTSKVSPVYVPLDQNPVYNEDLSENNEWKPLPEDEFDFLPDEDSLQIDDKAESEPEKES